MSLANPLSSLQLSQAQRLALDVFEHWIILSIDPSGSTLPPGKFRSILSRLQPDQDHQQPLKAQSSKQVDRFYTHAYLCYELLYTLGYRSEQTFSFASIEQASAYLDMLPAAPLAHAYPYQVVKAWYIPQSAEAYQTVGMLTAHMLNCQQAEALHFAACLLINWLAGSDRSYFPQYDVDWTLNQCRGDLLRSMGVYFEP